MAAYLNRTMSMITGNGTDSTDHSAALLDRSLHNNTAYENSPLQIFVKAKKKINDIFGEIEEYVIETSQFTVHGEWHADDNNGKKTKISFVISRARRRRNINCGQSGSRSVQ